MNKRNINRRLQRELKSAITSEKSKEIAKNAVALTAMNMSSHITPVPLERAKSGSKSNDVYMEYGINNLYPNFLLKLYNDSPIHKGIVNSKVDWIFGDGVVFEDNDEFAEFYINPIEGLESFVRKLSKDLVIFNYFAVEVIYNAEGMAVEFNHIPAHKIRTNKGHSKFWYSDDWAESNPKTIDFAKWHRQINSEDGIDSRVYFYCSYTPSAGNVYPVPEYSGAIKSVETDISIRDFHINNITNNFSVSSIITFFNGEPPKEVKEDIDTKIKNSYTGQNGQKLIINYANENSKGAEVKNISPTEWNNAYETLKKDTIQDIIVAHSVTSPMLVGVKTEGQLGGATELETAYEIFKSLYINSRRQELAQALNTLFEGLYKPIKIKDKRLFAPEVDNALKEKICTIDELRAEMGLAPLPNGRGTKLISEDSVKSVNIPVTASMIPSEVQANKTQSFSDDHRDLDFNKIAHLGMSSDEFITLKKSTFSSQDDQRKFEIKFNDYFKPLNDWLMTNDLSKKTLVQIKNLVNTATGNEYIVQDIKNEVARLIAARIIPNTDIVASREIERAKIETTQANGDPVANANRVELRYSYEGPSDDRNRAFCHKVVRSNKYYSREDIQRMSEIFGYDVMLFRGGFNCRHRFKSVSVVKR